MEKFNTVEAIKIIAEVLSNENIGELTIKKEDFGKFELWNDGVYIGRYSTVISEEKILKTGYEWCLDGNIRVLNLADWDTSWTFYEESYFEEKIDVQEFYKRIGKCKVKADSMPRKSEKYLEYRMYGLVPYNMSPIQQGIQFGHAVVDYGRTCDGLSPHQTIYNKWADKDKTFIILNGGTTNNNPERLGTLNQHLNTMREAGVLLQEFYEPDLGDQLTAFVFLVDERVFNKTLYPDFSAETLPWSKRKPSEAAISQLDDRNKKNYKLWEEKIGKTNVFLRDYLRNFKLA